jgi:hypothetical protein
MVPSSIEQNVTTTSKTRKMLLTDLLDLPYHQECIAVNFYRGDRNQVIASLKKKGNIIKWQNNKVLDEDKQLSPTSEEIILINVLSLIDN